VSHAAAPPPLHVVTDDAVLALPDFLERARAVLAAGGRRVALHLRGAATDGARLYALAEALRDPARAAGALLLANDRVDVALVAALDGAHLAARSLPPAEARRLLPPDSWIGVSVHDEGGARAAARDADYLVVGTVFATASHPGRAGFGPAGVAQVRAAVGLPLVAIGGITVDRVPEVVGAGAQGVAVLGGIWSAGDPAGAVADYLGVL
jgi:thiamine-phosphate pyrophosphorylase